MYDMFWCGMLYHVISYNVISSEVNVVAIMIGTDMSYAKQFKKTIT